MSGDVEVKALVEALRHDAGNYGRLMRGEVADDELVSWDKSHERAWQAADALEAVSARPLVAGREAVAETEAKEYAGDDMEAYDDFLTGWRTADRLRTVGLTADREAVVDALARADALSDEQWSSREFIYGPQADALLASGVIQSKNEAKTETLKEAKTEVSSLMEKPNIYSTAAVIGIVEAIKVLDALSSPTKNDHRD